MLVFYRFFTAIIVFFAFSAYAYAINSESCYQNDISVSKSNLVVGDLFFGASLSIYGIICPDNDYAFTAYLDNTHYIMTKNEKNSLGMVVKSNHAIQQNYYGFFLLRGAKNAMNFNIYPNNSVIETFLKNNRLYTLDQKAINVKKNGVFKEKIYIPKATKPGQYITEMYVFDKVTHKIKSLDLDSFNVILHGNGSIIRDIMAENRLVYTMLCIVSSIAISCAVTFLMDFFKTCFTSGK